MDTTYLLSLNVSEQLKMVIQILTKLALGWICSESKPALHHMWRHITMYMVATQEEIPEEGGLKN